MKKLLLISSAIAISASLAGCNTMNDTANYANSTVGSGVKYTARTVGTGVGVISDTGAAIGNGVGTVVNGGVGMVSGHSTTYHHNTMHGTKAHMMYRHGHHYMLKNGKYVRMN